MSVTPAFLGNHFGVLVRTEMGAGIEYCFNDTPQHIRCSFGVINLSNTHKWH